MSARPFFSTMLCAVLCTGACRSSHAVVFTNDTTIAPGNTDYEGDNLVVSNCTLTVRGSHSFGGSEIIGGSGVVDALGTNTFDSLLVHTGATCRLRGGSALNVTGTLTVRTNAAVEVQGTNRASKVGGEWRGLGGTITAGNAVVDTGGVLTADGYGYVPTAGPGVDTTDNWGGGSHGGRGNGNVGFRYGSARHPAELGSGAAYHGGSSGGGAIRLGVAGTLTLDGEITADGARSSIYDAGSGGSIWVTAGTLTGNGFFTADGGWAGNNLDGGGGRIAVYSDNMSGFTGFGLTTATGDSAGQRGTVAFYDSAGDDLTVYDHFIFEGAVTTAYHSVTLKDGSTALMNGAATMHAAATVRIESNAVLHVLSTNHTARVGGLWVGRGGTLTADTLTVERGGTITADGHGYLPAAGPGVDTTDNRGGGSHGGRGNGNVGFRYGSARHPVELGSGASYHGGSSGGGAIRLDVAGTLTLDGEITADGARSSIYEAGSGGSIWVTAGTLTGNGFFTADGGWAGNNLDGGGGRIAVYSDNMSGFTGFGLTTATGDSAGQRGTVAFYDSAGDDLTVYDHFIFEGAVTTAYHSVTLKDGSTTLMNGAATVHAAATLRIESNAVVHVLSTNHTAQVGGQWVGRGGTLTADTLTVERGGVLTADGYGYVPTAGPGVDTTDNWGGGSHGGRGNGNVGFRYGSARHPVELGSGASYHGGSSGGGAIRLDVAGTLTLDGEITADGNVSSIYSAGAGGSIWVTAGTLAGSGFLTADGAYGGGDMDGGGGRIAVYSDNMSGFTGFTLTTATGESAGQRGTVAFYDSAGDDLTVYDHFIFEAAVTTAYHSVTLKDGSTTLMNGPATVDVSAALDMEGNAVLHVLSTNRSARVGGQWAGRGGTIRATTFTVASGATVTADGQGYVPTAGPGADPDTHGGGSYGGRGAWGAAPYGSARQPTDLGSGGSYHGGSPGGGAIRVEVAGALALNGEVTADGAYSHNYDGGAGGSIWVTAGTLTGNGFFTADGGWGGANRDGGGGRIAVYSDNMTNFTGVTNSTARGDTAGQRGTVAFYDRAGDDLTVYDHFIVEGSVTTSYHSVTFKNGSVVLLNGACTFDVTTTLNIESNVTLHVLSTNHTAAVEGLWLGRGGTIRAGDLNLERSAVITADGRGYLQTLGPGSDPDSVGGGSHGGQGNAGAARYGSFRQPVELGSGGSYSGGSPGGGAIRIEVADTFTLNGEVTADGAYSHNYDGGAGGSIWVTTGTLTGGGVLTADGGWGGANRDGGGGRIAAYSDNMATFTGFTKTFARGDSHGQSGTVGFLDRSGSALDVYHHFIFEPGTTPQFASLTLHSNSVVQLYGEAVLTVTNTLLVESNAIVYAHGANRSAPVLGEWRGAGPAVYAGNLMVDTGGLISAAGLGYTSGVGPGADTADNHGGGSHGGRGMWGADPYGTEYMPVALGSGGSYGQHSGPGGGAIRLVVSETLTLDGQVDANGHTSFTYDGGAGGSVWIDAGTIAGGGTITANGGPGGGNRDGGGGRVAVYYWNNMPFAHTNISVEGDSHGEDGSIFLSSEPLFIWLRPTTVWAHDRATFEWAGAGVDPRSVRVDVRASSGATTHTLATRQPASGDVEWDTSAAADGSYTLKAVFTSLAGEYKGEAVRDILINNAAVWHGGTIDTDETWTDDSTHIIESDLVVAAGVTITIEPGAVVKLVGDVRVTVADGGVLNAAGTNDELVVFTSLADDTVGGDTNLDGDRSLPQPGHWAGVTVQGSGAFTANELTELRYVRIAHSGTLAAGETWGGTYAHEIADDLVVPSGATLTIEPGAIVKLDTLKRIRVQSGGTLIAKGTRARPIAFTSLKDDAIGGDLNGDGDATTPGAGDWMGIHADGGTLRLDHVVVAYGGGQSGGWNSYASAIRCHTGSDVTVSNSLVREAFYDGIVGWDGGSLRVVNTVVENCDRGINVHGTQVYGDIVNCSLVNNRIGLWVWRGFLDMDNTIISHSHDAGVHISAAPTAGDMHYCNVWSPTGDRFQNMADPTGSNGMISEDPKFKDLAGGDYRPRFGSPCIDAGNTPAAHGTDKMGAPRYDDPRTDNTGVPDGQGAVADIGAYEFVEGAESDLDLVVTDVRGPAVVTAGGDAEITWTVRNVGSARVEGSWHDRIRLTPISPGRWAAPLVAGEALATASLGPNQDATFSATVRVPGGTEGDWRWEVRANSDGAVFEGIHWNNNTRAARAVSQLQVPAITEGASDNGLYVGEDVPAWYKIDLSATQEVVAVVDSGMATGRCRLYAGYGDMPTEERFDARSTEWNAPDARLAVVAAGEPVTAYLMIVPERIGDADHTYTLSATAAAFELDSLGLDQAGNAGDVTIPIYGSRFTDGLTAALRPGAGGDIVADSVLVVDGTMAMATFRLDGAAVGTYDAVIAYGGLERSLGNAFRIVTGTGGRLETSVIMPNAVRAGRVFTGYVEYRNIGDANLAAPLLTIQGVGGDVNLWFAGGRNSSNSSFNVLAVAQDNPLPSVLAPGSTYSVEFKAFETIEPELVVNVSVLTTADTLPPDYDALEAAMRPTVPCFLWSNIWQEVVNRGGSTRGEYVTMLGAAADRAKGYGLGLMTEWDLLTFVIWETREDIKPASVAGTLYRNSTDNPIARCVVTLAATNQYTSTLATNETYHAQTWYDGRFGFVNVPPGTYALSAKGYLPLQLLTIDLPDPVGSPVTGLTVIAESRAGAIHGYVSDGSGGPPVRDVTVTARNARTGRTSVGRTDVYGYYMIHSLEPGTYSLFLTAAGWLPEAPREVALGAGGAVLESFALSRNGARIDGTVRVAGGPAVSNALVRLSFLDAARRSWAGDAARTDGAGAYAFTALPPGRYAVAASAPGHGASGRRSVRLNGYDDEQTVDIDLVAAVSLTGTVVAADGGAPIENAAVSVNAHPAPLAAAVTDAAGGFVIDDLAPGTYDVFAAALGYDVGRASVTLSGGPLVVSLAERGEINGTVRRGTNIVAGLDVTVVSQSKELDWTETTDDYGRYGVGNLHTGRYTVAVGSSSGLSLARREISVSATQSTVTCDFNLDVSVVSGTVYQPNGATPMSNAVVSLLYGDAVVARRITDGSGEYKFLVYEPGVFTVTTMGADGLAAPLTNVVAGTNVVLSGQDLTAGTNSVDCTVTASGSPVEDAVVRLQSINDPSSNALYLVYRTAPDGTCMFDGVADGTYRVRVSAGGQALIERDITLPGGGTQVFALETGRVLQGRVTSTASGGAPAPNILVSVGNARLGEIAHRLTDADGCYEFDSLPRDVLNVVAAHLGTVEAATNAVDTRSLAVQTLDLQVEQPSATEISGTVTNHLGAPVSGANAMLVNDAGSAVAVGITDPLGQYRLTGWLAGTFTLEATAPGYVPGCTSLVVSIGVDVTGQGLLLTGPVAEWSPGPAVQPPGGEHALLAGLTDWVPDFLTGEFWRDVLSGDYGLPPPSYYNNQLGGDRLVDRWRAYYFGLDVKKYMYCYKVDAAAKKCFAADDKVFETYMKFTEDWDILKDVNQANVLVVAGQNALLAAKLTKFATTIAMLKGYKPPSGAAGLSAADAELIKDFVDVLMNSVGLATSSLAKGDTQDFPSYLTTIDLYLARLKHIHGLELDGIGAINEAASIFVEIKNLWEDYKNLENDAIQRFQQYTDDVNAYVDAVKNLHRAFHDLKAAVALCDNPEEEDESDDDPPEPDNEGEGGGDGGDDDEGDTGGDGEDGDGSGATGGTPWGPDDGGWHPSPTPGGTPPAPFPPGGGSGGTGGGNGGSSGSSSVLGSKDPNDKLTVGFGPRGFIGPETVLHYTIRFENMTNATLPAFRVTVTDSLATNLDWSTFEFEDLRFNNVTVKVPPGLQSYFNDGVTVPSDPNPVEIQADLDPYTGEIRWRMESVDPVTGGLPEDPFAGFLPSNTNAPAGEGYVKFAIKARYDAWDTMVVTNTADIVFDYNESIATPPVTNTVDSMPPASAVAPLAAASPRTFTVNWAGDDGLGAGIVSYDVYVAREGAAPLLWLAGTTNNQAEFTGEPGVAYSFHCIARDGVGLTEPAPSGPDAATRTVYYLTEIGPVEGELRIQWESATGKVYRVLQGTDLLAPLTPIASNLPATPPQNTFTTRVDGVGGGYYRVGIE